MKISQTGIDLIKKYEGCQLKAYQDSIGVWTIGYGHTNGVTSGMTITKSKAESYLNSDIAKFEENVNKIHSKYAWNQNELDALVSFAYNIGSIDELTANGSRSKEVIASKIPEYNKAGGKVLLGLTKRRAEEKKLFLTACGLSDAEIKTNIKIVQKWLNEYLKDILKPLLVVDGECGDKTKEALIMALQKAINEDYRTGRGLPEIKVNGIFGSETEGACPSIKLNMKNSCTKVVQAILYCRGYNPQEFTGRFNSDCVSVVKEFQSDNRITVDEIFGVNSFTAAFN